ncbi:RlmE family RNA methyltransferase [Candidatus Bathyarchaeota archaeon]|nr:RlmE family RNA methyltransferase [Candidatus Bathyarchaeota archaeon]
MPKRWVRGHRKDYFYLKAKEEDYRSRAFYKLLQAFQKYQFIKPRDVVVDLGAAPGGWLQATRKIVGAKGFVLGVDLVQIEPFEYPNVFTIVGDITEPELVDRIKAILPRKADVVISDVSPHISGIWEVDHARQIDLANSSLHIAKSVLRDNGNFFVKLFQGDLFNSFLNMTKKSFTDVKVIKPQASRKESAEIYVLGLGFKSKNTSASSCAI